MKRTFVCLLLCLLLPTASIADTIALSLKASNAILIDGKSGDVIYEQKADERIYPASTTKILTVFLGFLLADTEQVIVVSPQAVRLSDPQAVRIGLQTGEQMSFRDLLYATMIQSGNDGANAVAEVVSGDQEHFAALMNQYAIGIGCTDTHFTNPSGLHDDQHYTTARDMAKIAFEAMQLDEFKELAAIGRWTMPATNMNKARVLSSHGRGFFDNPQSSYYFDGACGIKTGYHTQAGYCFVAAAEREEGMLIAAVFGCKSYAECFRDAAELLQYGFSKK